MRPAPFLNALLGALSFAPLLVALSYLPVYFGDEPLVFKGVWAMPSFHVLS